MVDKVPIKLQEYYSDSISLGKMIHDSGFKPDFLVAIWRGGTFPGMIVQEYLKSHGIETDHIAIRTSKYNIDQENEEIQVHGLGYIIDQIEPSKKEIYDGKAKTRYLILLDDIFDTGETMCEVLKQIHFKSEERRKELEKRYDFNIPLVPINWRIGTVHYKPEKNRTCIVPDFWVREFEKEEWIVYPHEFSGLSKQELIQLVGKDIRKFYTDL